MIYAAVFDSVYRHLLLFMHVYRLVLGPLWRLRAAMGFYTSALQYYLQVIHIYVDVRKTYMCMYMCVHTVMRFEFRMWRI